MQLSMLNSDSLQRHDDIHQLLNLHVIHDNTLNADNINLHLAQATSAAVVSKTSAT